jgi:glycosyltransferase involved in cell wall biosynthesis
MKILILHNQLWSQYKSIIFENINNLCQKNGDELLVLQTSISEISRKDLIDFDINNFNYNYKFILLNNKYLESTNSIYTTFKWLKYIFIYKPDVINLTGYSELGTIFVLLVTKLLNIKTIITNESVYQKHSADFNMLFYIKKKYKNLLFSLTDYFFSYGINSNDFLFRHNVHKSKILSFLNSFDSERLKGLSKINYKNEDQYFLFVGRISNEKNIDFLLQLAIKFKEANSDILIKIIGSGPELDRLNSEIRILNLSNILFVGSVNWENLGEYYSKSLGLILPSFFEPWGMVANEAFFYNTPVICSKFCGCASDLVINNFNGLVLEDYSLSCPNNDFTFFIDHFLHLRDKFVDNIKLTNRIFEPGRLSNDLYQSFNNIV